MKSLTTAHLTHIILQKRNEKNTNIEEPPPRFL